MALITVTGTFTNPDGASVENADIINPAPIKVYENGIESLTATISFQGAVIANSLGNQCFMGNFTISNFQSGTTLSFRYGSSNLIGNELGFNGDMFEREIPNQSTPYSLPEVIQVYFNLEEVYGCTNPDAMNYNSDANTDDGSCVYFDYTDKIVITEVHYNPNDDEQPDIDGETPDDETDESWEFFEIHNPTEEVLPLAGLGISFYGTGAEYKRNGDLWSDGMPADATIRPYGRIVFANTAATYNGTCYCVTEVEEVNRDYAWTSNPTCDDTACPENSEFRSFEHLIAYDGTNAGTANLYEWQSGNRKLGNTGYNITIRDGNPVDGPNNTTGNIIDTIKYHSGTYDANNSCTYDWPSSVSTYGRSIVLHHHSLDNNCGRQWYRSGVRGGSPGLPNALSWNSEDWKTLVGGSIAISEVYIDPPAGLESSHEFIEITNRSNTPLSMEGWIDISSTGYRPIEITTGAENGGMPPLTLNAYSNILLVKKDGDNAYDTYTCQTMWTYEGFMGNTIDNAGEVLSIRDMFGTLVDQLDMNQFDSDWDASEQALGYPFASTQGLGSTVQLKTWDNDCYDDNNNPSCWQASVFEHGNPCQASTQPIFGCTDNTACNFDDGANVDDESCTYPKLCCPDTNTNGLCDNEPSDGYVTTCNQCPANTIEWFSDLDPGYDVYGCMDETNCNYNPNATWNQTSDCLTLDCNNDCGGSAELNYCGECIFGNTAINDDSNGYGGYYGQDCNNDCIPTDCSDINTTGCAEVDECGTCVGGDTEHLVYSSQYIGDNYSYSSYPTLSYSLIDTDGIAYIIFTAALADCNGDCIIEGDDYSQTDYCNICGGTNTSDGGPQMDCNPVCFGDAVDLGCGCGDIAAVDYYLDTDGDGLGGGTAFPFCEDPGDGYVLNSIDTNDYCDDDSEIGDFYTGNDFGLDDCGFCHYTFDNTLTPNFNYFGTGPFNTSKDCGDGINTDSGLCPGDLGFNNPPGTHRGDTNDDGNGNECFETLIWYTSNNTFDFGNIINHGCNFTNVCKGDDTVWGPNTLMGVDGEFIDISGQTSTGCRDTLALNYQVRHYFDCAGTPLGDNNSNCCNYPLDCNGDEGGSASLDDCGVCSGGNTNHMPNSDKDCYGTCPNDLPASSECADGEGWNQVYENCQLFGSFFDACDVCVGGGSPHEENSNMDCNGDCFGEAQTDADGNGNCCMESQVQIYYYDNDGDGLGDPLNSNTYCQDDVPVGWVTNNLDTLGDDYYCPNTCDENGNNQSSGEENVCIVDCNGVCGGYSVLDSCGNCTLPNQETDIDCAGTCDGAPGYGSYLDDCENCVGGNTTSDNQGCFDQVDSIGYTEAEILFNTGGTNAYEGTCPPLWAQDCGGVCLGNAVSDCAGNCGGSNIIDECGECYNPANNDAPNVCVGCTDITSCNYDPEATIDGGDCKWFNCVNECICDVDNQNDASCGTILDLCGECGGDNDCNGCTDPTAINYDVYATQNFENECVYGDILITPSSTNGMGNDFILVSVVGNDDEGQNKTCNHDGVECTNEDYNSNFGGWKFQDSDEVITSYELFVDRKTGRLQTEPESGYTINTSVTENIDGEIIDGGYNSEYSCNWLTQNPNSNPNTGQGLNSFESFINCGYGKTLDTDGTYFVKVVVVGSLGTTVEVQREFAVDGIFRIEQSLKFNELTTPQMYTPQQGINIPYNETTGSFQNKRYWYDLKNKFDRMPLGCFYYDEDQLDDWENLSQPYRYLDKHIEISFEEHHLQGFCANITHIDDDGNTTSGTCISGVNDGEPCSYDTDGSGDSSCGTTITNLGNGNFSPDIVGTSKQAQYLSFGYSTPLSERNKGKLHEYYSKETDLKNFEALQAPKEFNFLFTPRASNQDMSYTDKSYGRHIFGTRNRLSLDDELFDYYIGFIDWGDETTSNDLDMSDTPTKLNFNSVISHRYSRPGIYEITGWMFGVYKNDACRNRCEISQVDETSEDSEPDWYSVNPSRYIFNVSDEFCSNVGGIYTTNVDNNCGVIDHKKFTYRINIPSNDDDDVFLPYTDNEPTIGGVSKDSIYYKTIQRELGYLITGGKIDLDFKYIQDKLNAEHAFVKMNDSALPDASVLGIFNQPILSGSVNFDGELLPSSSVNPNPVAVVSGSYTDGYGELSVDNYFGNSDINQVRFFSDGELTMDKMLGFVNITPDMSYKLWEGEGSVLITAPHSPVTLRPTSLGYDPDGQYPAWPHEPDDYTGAMAYYIGKMTNSHVLISTYMQDDANYYHHIGRDYFGRTAETATPAFVGMEGQLHPFKKKLKEYLIEHPEIKLVIDLHGAGDYRPFAADIGVAYPQKNRDPDGDYQTGYVDAGWYPGNTEGLNLYSMEGYDFDEDFPGPANPVKERFWNGNLDSQWDVFGDIDRYAPSMVTDLGKGLTSPQNPNGESLLKKLIEIMESHNIGDGDGYRDRYYSSFYQHNEEEELGIVYYYFRGEFLEQQSHSCPDKQDNSYNLAGYLNDCDLSIYDDCTDAWDIYLDGTYYCAEPGIKKPVLIGRDFTAGAQNTVTRYVTLDAKDSDFYFSDDDAGAIPASFLGNVDAFQLELSRNHREFDPQDPVDLRTYKALIDFIKYINTYYGIEVDATHNYDYESDEFKQTYNQTFDFYINNLKPQGEILLDESVALTQHPNNPSSKRYWKNIIPDYYDVGWREGLYEYSTELNTSLYRGGQNELRVLPNNTLFNYNSTLLICKEGESVGGEPFGGWNDDSSNLCDILFDDVLLHNYKNSGNRIISTYDKAKIVTSNNLVYWDFINTTIGSDEFNTIFDGNNNVEQITWVSNGKLRNTTYFDGTWSEVVDDDYEKLNVLEKGRYYLFIMYNGVDLQRDNLDANIPKTYLSHNMRIDINSNQEWLKQIINPIFMNDDLSCEAPNDLGCESERGSLIKFTEITPYYPVLPKLDLFGNFSTDEDLQKSYINLDASTLNMESDDVVISEDAGSCQCDSDGVLSQFNCSIGYESQCIFISTDNYNCSCFYIPSDDDNYESGDSNDYDFDTAGDSMKFRIENNIPYGSPDRLWYEYDMSSPAVNENYPSNKLSIQQLSVIDISFEELDDNRLYNNSGVELYNYVFGDYKINFDGETRIPEKGDFENLPQIRNDGREAF
tara:strand:- start:12467 stop:21781 length:9315 start_codon:yes stop_codon:yes gene_type:complete